MGVAKDIKVILTAPVHMLSEAHRAFDCAYHNSDFSHGFAFIALGNRHWVVKKNKGGFSVLLSGSQP